jgi:hypothetical protein
MLGIKHHAAMHQFVETAGTDREVASWIWRNLVPKNGQANTVQGELLRAVEKLRWEAQENGNINWDQGFLMLLQFLEEQLGSQQAFSDSQRKTIRSDLARLREFLPADELHDEADSGSLPYIEDDLYDRLEGFVVAFARVNPRLLAHTNNPKLFR